MIRLAVPIVILLLMLFAGAVWALFAYLDLPQMAGGPAAREAAFGRRGRGDPRPRREQAQTEAQATFDVARIDPKGTSVFAGRAEPGAQRHHHGRRQAHRAPLRPTRTANGPCDRAPVRQRRSQARALGHEACRASRGAGAPTQVAGSLEAHEAPAEEPPRQVRQRRHVAPHEELRRHGRGGAHGREKKRSSRQESEKEVTAEAPATLAPTSRRRRRPQARPIRRGRIVDLAARVSNRQGSTAVLSLPRRRPRRRAGRAQVHSRPHHVRLRRGERLPTTAARPRGCCSSISSSSTSREITLTGHADERGTDEFNMELSQRTARHVAKYLREGGYKGELELIPKGKIGAVHRRRAQPSTRQEELWQFDRRVELDHPALRSGQARATRGGARRARIPCRPARELRPRRRRAPAPGARGSSRWRGSCVTFLPVRSVT